MSLAFTWNGLTPEGKPLYSDHAPIQCHGLLSWNIMNKCWRSPTATNNGYGITESSADFTARLQRIAIVIGQVIKAGDAQIIALQEAPQKGTPEFQYFKQQLKMHLGREFIVDEKNSDNTPGTTSSRFTIFHKSLRVQNVSSTYQSKLGLQQGRVQIFQAKDTANRSFMIANCHMNYGKDIQEATNNMMKDGMIAAGDFNAPVASFARHVNVKEHELRGANFSFNISLNCYNPVTQYDAIVVSNKCIADLKPSKSLPSSIGNVKKASVKQFVKNSTKPDDNTAKEYSFRRRFFAGLGSTHLSIFAHPLTITASVLGFGALYAYAIIPTIFVAILAATCATLLALHKFSFYVNQEVMAFDSNHSKWKQQNRQSYELGVQAIAWMPYLTSMIKPKAYTAAFQVGIIQSAKEKALRTSHKRN
jgi:hypothetical protein